MHVFQWRGVGVAIVVMATLVRYSPNFFSRAHVKRVEIDLLREFGVEG
jgi:hypothetical protein